MGFLFGDVVMTRIIGIAIVVLVVSALVVRFVGAFIAFGMGDSND